MENSRRLVRQVNLPVLLKLFLCALCAALVVATGAFQVGLTQSPPERKLRISEFNGMPVAVKEVRNLQQEEDWFRDLEIEVENISDRPIYFISLIIEFPDIPAPPQMRADGTTPSRTTTGIGLSFGALRLGDVKNVATPDDPSLKPGETYVFKVPDGWVQGFEHMKRERNLRRSATEKIDLEFDTISFGDGSGYIAGEKRVYEKKSNGWR